MTTAPTSVSPNFAFVLQDFTTDATPAQVRPQSLSALCAALLEQAINYGAHHGMPSVSFRVATSPTDRQPEELAINFRDSLPEAPGALAYHLVVAGIPDIEVGCDLYSTWNAEDGTTVGISHEVLETFKDEGANGWAEKQDGTGQMGALEDCDPVQNTSYQTSNGTWVSNFVLPSYFIPGAVGPYDFLGKLAAVTNAEIEKYGYEIQAGAPTSTTSISGFRGLNIHHGRAVFIVGAELTEQQTKRKSHPWSRTHRRGVRL